MLSSRAEVRMRAAISPLVFRLGEVGTYLARELHLPVRHEQPFDWSWADAGHNGSRLD